MIAGGVDSGADCRRSPAVENGKRIGLHPAAAHHGARTSSVRSSTSPHSSGAACSTTRCNYSERHPAARCPSPVLPGHDILPADHGLTSAPPEIALIGAGETSAIRKCLCRDNCLPEQILINVGDCVRVRINPARISEDA